MDWYYWIILGIVLLLAELLGMGFYAVPIAIGAFVTAVIALNSVSITSQWLFFAIASLVFTLIIKYFFKAKIKSQRLSLLVGEGEINEATLSLDDNGQLRVIIDGDSFLVRLNYSSEQPLLAGDRVRVLRFDGITAIVEPIN